ncbi:MAG: M1 family peptidase, partial [Candidatus Krumholzibacteriota bacterium]|nr:M1 family peptidase [Candidatus Krumholzibacteriota bacterium]
KGRERAFQWMMANYEGIAERLPAMYLAYMPYYVSGCSQERLAAAEAFFSEPAHSVPGTDKNMKKVGDQVMDCINLREREGPAVRDYLTRLAAR